MLRPKRERPTNTSFSKFVMYFGMFMTLVYIALGLFLIFADENQLNLSIPSNVRIILGGVLILYGIIRFIRVYQQSMKDKRKSRYDEE